MAAPLVIPQQTWQSYQGQDFLHAFGPGPGGANLAILGNNGESIFPVSVEPPVVLSGSADALTPLKASLYMVTTAGVDSMTLSTPVAGDPRSVAGGMDGFWLSVYDTGGHAHTITTAAGKINGALHIATFSGTVGVVATFVAYNGIWYAAPLTGIVLS